MKQRWAFAAFYAVLLAVSAWAWYDQTAPTCSTDTECETWCGNNTVRCVAGALTSTRR